MKIKNLFNIIFDKYYDNCSKHYIYKFLFIKIKVKNEYVNIYNKIDGIYSLINYAVDITKIPQAKNFLRTSQLDMLHILNLIDKICKENNLKYWLDFGTLLGAVRHKGFIPWDDDLDISMLRSDYLKILPILKKEFENNKNFYIRERHPIFNNFQIRIRNLDKNYGIDIFPVDVSPVTEINADVVKRLNKKIDECQKIINDNFGVKQLTNISINEAKKIIIETHKKLNLIADNQINEPKILFYSADYPHHSSYKVFDYSTIFPLKELEFEGYQFYVPNDYKKHLELTFGNYMNFPNNFENVIHFVE